MNWLEITLIGLAFLAGMCVNAISKGWGGKGE